MANKITSLAGMTEYGLDNGLRILLIPDPSQATVTVNLTVFAGSSYEGYGETGAAHLLEHLAFKGTPDFADVPAALNEHGAAWNGTTWTDRTNYYETMPASAENLDFGIRFEASRLVRSWIRAEDLASEMTVVRNEFESGENHPPQVLLERVMSLAYLFHGYGHPTIGARSDIEDIPIDRLRAFYERWYRVDNAQLTIAGRFDEADALTRVDRYFGALARPAAPLPKPYTVEPAQDGERTVSLRRVGDVGAVVAAYHIPGGAHPDAAALEVLGEVFGATPTGRLHRELVPGGKAVRTAAMVFLFRDPGLMVFMLEARKSGNMDELRQLATGIIEGLADTPVSDAEVERGRNALLADRTLVFANSEKLAIEMSEWAAMGDWRLFFAHRAALEQVTAADLQRVAIAYLRSSNRTLGVYVPADVGDRVEIPPVGDLEARLHGLEAAAEASEPESLGVEPELLESRTRRGKLASGAPYAWLPKRTRGSLASLRLQLAVGEPTFLAEHRELNDITAGMLDRGTESRDRSQLKDDLDRLRADLRVIGDSNEVIIRFTAPREHVPEVLTMCAEMLRMPRFDPEEFAQLREERLAELEEASREPSSVAVATLRNSLYPPGHIRHQELLEAQMEYLRTLDLKAVRSFHERFYGMTDACLTGVGDFDPDATGAQLERLLGDWRGGRDSRRIDATNPPAAAPGVRVVECPDKENAMTVAARTFPMTQDDPRFAALLLGNFMVGGEALRSRLSSRLRQADGLCYGVGTNVMVDLRGDLGAFSFWAISAPGNVARVELGMREELSRVCADGFGEDEVSRARAAYLEQIDVRLSRDGALASEMIDQLVRDRNFDELAELQTALRTVPFDVINAVAAEHFDPTRLLVIQAGDFSKVKPASSLASS